MNLMFEEELDIENIFDFVLINNLNEQQWQDLLPKMTAKINLANENLEIINKADIDEQIISINSNGNNYVIFPDWSTDEEQLSIAISKVLTQNAEHRERENMTLLVDINGAKGSEIGLFFSEVAMNLMLVEGIELPETINISFIDFTVSEWQSISALIKEKITIIGELLPAHIHDW